MPSNKSICEENFAKTQTHSTQRRFQRSILCLRCLFFFLRSGICLFEFGLCDRQQRIKIIAIKPLWVRSRIVMVKAYSSFGLHEKCLVIFGKNLSFRPFVCLPIGNAGNIFSSILLLWVFCFFSSSSVFFLFVFITTTTSLSIHLMSV